MIKHNKKIMVLAETDHVDLSLENRNISTLNQEIKNLKGQLLKEKKRQQNTLDELKETQQLLVQSEKMNALGQLVAGVAHELNNPVSFVAGNIYSLDSYVCIFLETFRKIENAIEENASPEIRNLVRGISKEFEFNYLVNDISDILKDSKQGIERVKRIIEDLRRFTRLDEPEVKHVNLIGNIDSALYIVNSAIKSKNLNFKFSSSTDNIYIDCYPGQLNQALLNTVIIAAQSAQEGGEISLDIKEKENDILISVKVSDKGESEKSKSKVLDPFFIMKPIGKGSGLGLSISQKIICELHGGKIDVISESNRNIGFLIKIPKSIAL